MFGESLCDWELVQEVDKEKLLADLADLKRQNPESVTISLLNAYANNVNEKTVSEIIRQELGLRLRLFAPLMSFRRLESTRELSRRPPMPW